MDMTPTYFPYRSAKARDSYFTFYDALAAKEWPVVSEERMVRTSYGETFVRVTGPDGAPPLVLLPGAVSTSLMWAPNIKALSEACRTYAVDQIGDVGRSTCTRPVRHLNDLLAWLDELFDALELGNGINLMGCSYGGSLTAEYAMHAPQRLNTVVLVAPGATVLHVSPEFVMRLALAAIASLRWLRPFIRWIFADTVRKDPAWLDPMVDQLRLAMQSIQRRLPIPPVWTAAKWRALTVPALFLLGEHETVYDAHKAVRRLKRVAPQVTAEILPGAGHDLTIVQAEMVNRSVVEFVKRKVTVPETCAVCAQ